MEEKALIWGSFIGFVSTLLAGYFLLKSADEENTAPQCSTTGNSHEIKEKSKKQSKKSKK